eukprot:CAMPEP_0184699910 /NCGR_PEP_ID=MMETSP0313-20130426/6399_1 /TAXON_ID=2792 /ORGANISM="Porphyridium aerugineum, Strain SAG 1380-2" /LENGTH=319 /DNA_ID=CAMNT_0027159103 /DNA_START=97 /DNA_END=1056 /DNA_ORIENTATION=-
MQTHPAFVTACGTHAATASSHRLFSCSHTKLPTRAAKSHKSRAPAIQMTQSASLDERDREITVDGAKIVYDYFQGDRTHPVVVYLPGFFYARSRLAKINALQMFCKRKRQGLLTLDYFGTGRSEGDFNTGTVSRWLTDTLAALDKELKGRKVVLVGSGIGGWIMLHVAMRRPEMVVGLVGLSADPDFTEELLVPVLTEEMKQTLEMEGVVQLKWGFRKYPISKALIDDGKKMRVLTGGKDSLSILCPVRLIQGMNDEEIPKEYALRLVECIRSEDVIVTFVKYGDHTLETDEDFVRMWEAVSEVSDKYFEFDLTSPSSG